MPKGVIKAMYKSGRVEEFSYTRQDSKYRRILEDLQKAQELGAVQSFIDHMDKA